MAVEPERDFTDRIREAALRLFNERGYGSATMEAIAQAAGVGVGTIYRRWPDKPALANDVFCVGGELDHRRGHREAAGGGERETAVPGELP